MLLTEMYENYKIYAEVYNAPGTLRYYKETINVLLKYFGNVDSSKITKNVVFKYIKYLMDSGLSNNTINKRIMFLKAMFKYNEIDSDFLKIKKLKEEFVTFGCVDPTTLKRIIKEILPQQNLQCQLIVRLLLDTGVRANELVNIKIKNIDLDNRNILLEKTKTGKIRKVFFTDFTKQLLMKYLINNKHEYLFYNSKTKTHITVSALESQFARLRRKYKLEKFSPHRLRHTLSSNMYANGSDYLFIMKILGHSNMNTTRRYIHDDDLQKLQKYDKYRIKIRKSP